jgi:O-antigen ligase
LLLITQIKTISKRIPLSIENLVLFLPLLTIQGYQFNYIITSLYVFFVFVIFLIDNLLKGNLRIELPKFQIWLLLLIWDFYILLKSPKLYDGITYYIGTVFIPFLLFIIIVNINLDKSFFEKLFYSFQIVAIICSAFSIYLFIISGFNTKVRISSFWEGQNMYAGYLMVILLFNFSFVINKKGRKNLIMHLISIPVILFAIILTQSRATFLALTVSIIFFIVKRPKVIFPFLATLGLMLMLFFDVIKDRVLSIIYFSSDLSSLGRIQGWISSIIIIKENYLFGYGFDAYVYLRDNVFSYYFVEVIHSHNTYLRLILETGLIGFVLYISILVIAIYYSFAINKNKEFVAEYKSYIDGLQMSFIGLLILFFFEPYFSLFDNSTLVIWIFISLMYLLYNNSFKNMKVTGTNVLNV